MEQKSNNLQQQNTEEIVGTTVLLKMEYADKNYSARGSGFFVAPDKIVTNVHVLVGATAVTAKNVDSEKVYTIEGIVAFDDVNDLAILKIAEADTPFPLGDSDKVRKGDQVSVIGYPERKARIVEGPVNSIRNSSKHLELNFKLAPGNSGGPVLNAKGQVIGVAKAGVSFHNRSPNGRAISSNVLQSLLENVGEVESLEVWQKRSQIHAYLVGREGNDSRERGKFRKAIAHFDTALKLNPDLTYIYYNRSAVKFLMGRYDEGYGDLLTGIRLNPERFHITSIGVFLQWKWEIVRCNGLRLLMRLISYVSGKSCWIGIIKGMMKIHFGEEVAKHGDIAEARKLYQEGIDIFTEAINQKPNKATFYNQRGWSKYLLGKFETEQDMETDAQRLYQEAESDADEALRLALKKTKLRSAPYHTRAVAKAGLGNHEGAIEDFDESINLNPRKALFYHDRGLSKETLGQHEAAKVDFAKAKELDPKIKK